MKKTLLLLLVVAILGTAGMAVAATPQEQGARMSQKKPAQPRKAQAKMTMKQMWAQAPYEIRAKIAQLQKLQIDQRLALSQKPLDREKVLGIHGKIVALRQELDAWSFNRRLNQIEKRRKAAEQQKPVSNATPTPQAESSTGA